MSTETQKVDVLENIKDAIKRTSPTTHFNERANLWVTLDAVDELIEALKIAFPYVNDAVIADHPDWMIIHAALARVGGAK